MCHDLSFSANTVEFITDLLPGIKINGINGIDFGNTAHVLSMAHRKIPVIIKESGSVQMHFYEWGLIADYMNTPELVKKYRTSMANCRAENIFEKKSAWYRIRNQRCLLAVDGIFEHREVKGMKNKIPYYITLQNSPAMLIPGLYNHTPTPDPETGELKGTCTLITRGANKLMQHIHNHGVNKHRMPLFMELQRAIQWINETLSEKEMQEMLDQEIPSEELNAWPVYSIRTTKPRPDLQPVTAPFNWPGLPPLGNDNITAANGTLF